MIRQPWHPWTKYWIVLSATLLTCVALYEFLLRRFALLRIAFGIKTHAPATQPGAMRPILASGANDDIR